MIDTQNTVSTKGGKYTQLIFGTDLVFLKLTEGPVSLPSSRKHSSTVLAIMRLLVPRDPTYNKPTTHQKIQNLSVFQ